jgi:predicted nucleic acid-binding protein
MTERVFVDTNVLVYLYEAADTAKGAIAREWIERLWRERSGRVSIQVLNELFVQLTRKLRHPLAAEEAWDVVNGLLGWDPQPVDRDVVTRAREVQQRYAINWWDSLIVAAAQAQECDVLLTEDLRNGMRFGPVTVRNPFVLQIQEPRATYSVIEEVVPRHRSRGRPRKERFAKPAAG